MLLMACLPTGHLSVSYLKCTRVQHATPVLTSTTLASLVFSISHLWHLCSKSQQRTLLHMYWPKTQTRQRPSLARSVLLRHPLTVVSTALSGPQHLAYTSSPVRVHPTEEGRSCDQAGMNKIYPPDPGKCPVTTPPPPLLSVLLLLPVPRGQLFCPLCQRPTGSLQSHHPTCSQISTPRPLRIQAAFLPGPGLTLTPGARPAEHTYTSQTASPRTAPHSPPPRHRPRVYRTLSVPGPPAPLNLAAYLDICTHMCSFYTSPCSAKGFCSLWRRKCKVSTGHHHIQLCRVFTAQEHPLRGTVGVQMQPLSVHQALQPSADYTFPERVPFPGWPSVFHGP